VKRIFCELLIWLLHKVVKYFRKCFVQSSLDNLNLKENKNKFDIYIIQVIYLKYNLKELEGARKNSSYRGFRVIEMQPYLLIDNTKHFLYPFHHSLGVNSKHNIVHYMWLIRD